MSKLRGTARRVNFEAMDQRHGLLIVFTGNGKGKTSAALGTALRGVGQGFRVLMIQFIKGPQRSGELDAALLLSGALEIRPMGRGFVNPKAGKHNAENIRLATAAWDAAVEAMNSAKYDILILDEINNAIDYGLIPLGAVLSGREKRPAGLHVICTGRNAPEELIEAADLVTEMEERKHPYQKGIAAHRGIEY